MLCSPTPESGLVKLVSCRSGATTAKKYAKKGEARAKLLFVNINKSFFAVLLAVSVVVGFVVIQK